MILGTKSVKIVVTTMIFVMMSAFGFSQSFLFNGKSVELESVLEKSGKTFFKVREVVEKAGGTIQYDSSAVAKINLAGMSVWLYSKDYKYVDKTKKKDETFQIDKESMINQGGSLYISQSALQNMLSVKIETQAKTQPKTEKVSDKAEKETKISKETKVINVKEETKNEKTEVKIASKDENQQIRTSAKITEKKSSDKVEKFTAVEKKEEKVSAEQVKKEETAKVKEEKNVKSETKSDELLQARSFTRDGNDSVVVLEFNNINNVKFPQFNPSERSLFLFKVENAKKSDNFNFADKSDYIKKVEALELGDSLWVKIELEDDAVISKEVVDNRVLLNFKFAEKQETAKKKTDIKDNNLKASNKGFTLPVYGIITSEYGWRTHPVFKVTRYHEGVDISAPTGTSIKSSTDGIVVDAYYHKTYGKMVRVKTSDNMYVLYAHMDTIKVSEGDRVSQGEILGTVGNTGISTGAHLHLQLEDLNGKLYNPREYCSDLSQLKVMLEF